MITRERRLFPPKCPLCKHRSGYHKIHIDYSIKPVLIHGKMCYKYYSECTVKGCSCKIYLGDDKNGYNSY